MEYFLEINLYLTVFFTFYWIFLRKETFFSANRFYLILSVLVSFIIPIISFDYFTLPTDQLENSVWIGELPELAVTGKQVAVSISEIDFIQIIYVIGLVFFALRFILQLWKSIQLVRQSEVSPFAAYTFLGKLVIGEKALDNPAVLQHEWIHIKRWHSLDQIFFELLKIFLWVNPIVYLLKWEIQLLHEYEADAYASQMVGSKAEYAATLISATFQINSDVLLGHSFNRPSSLKSRLIMLTKHNSKKQVWLKYTLTLPLVLCLIFLSNLAISQVKEAKVPSDDVVFVQVEEVPEFIGGEKAMFRYLGQNIRYPEAAIKENIQGRVTAKFIVEKDGSIEHVEILNGPHPDMNNEVVRLLRQMPKWKPAKQKGKPVRVYYTLPVVFSMSKN
jgi:TonB family protein